MTKSKPTKKLKIKNRFTGLIGQVKAKRKMDFHLDNFDATKVLPHMMFIAPKGCGKTLMAKAVGRNLLSAEPTMRVTTDSMGERATTEIPAGEAPKRFLEVNCSSIKSVPQFVEGLLMDKILNQEVTVLFDEAHMLPNDVSMFLLTALNPNPNNFNSMTFNDHTFDFNFRRQTFMFATTEAHKIFHALIDRCDRVDLEEYTMTQLGAIVELNLTNLKLKCDESLLEEIAIVLRGNARAAQKMANNMKNYLARAKKKKFDVGDWAKLKYALGIMPLGLNDIEIQILKALRGRKDCSLTNLSAKVGLTAQCIRQDFEMYLQKTNLMSINTGGRSLTVEGKDYLKKHNIK
jgi:Holliday junction resolvasome RuvABC ATP-dependent DNA helicase subunit